MVDDNDINEFTELVESYLDKIEETPDPAKTLVDFINDFSILRGGKKILDYAYAEVDEKGHTRRISQEEYLHLKELEKTSDGELYDESVVLALEDQVHNLAHKNDLLYKLLEEKIEQLEDAEEELEILYSLYDEEEGGEDNWLE